VGVIARVWRGAVRAEDADEYVRYVEANLDVARALPGNRAAYVMQRRDGEHVEIVTMILWDSLDDVRAFAGDEIERAVFFDDDDRYLVERDETVRHYDVDGPPE
jgi:heme-degrading monooxygenase HmoA